MGLATSCLSRIEKERKKKEEDEHMKELIRQVMNENSTDAATKLG